MDDLALRYYELFGGLDRAHGTYTITTDKAGKQKGIIKMIHGRWGKDLWAKHLAGKYGLGIVPITDDATCRFGCIDIDDRTIDHKQLEKLIDNIGLPLIVCRSKSGGAHLFLFVRDFTAESVVDKLAEWAIILGYSGVEIFPKQIELAKREGENGLRDMGSWLNMPYQSGEKTTRYAFYKGTRMTPEAFIQRAEEMQFADVEELNELKIKDPLEQFGNYLDDAPPCLCTCSIKGFPEGTRNNGMFNFCVYLRKRYPDSWKDYVLKYNEKFMNPPLNHSEITALMKSVGGQKYQYKCNDQPIVDCCARKICYTRKYGVGDDDQDPGVDFGQITRILTEPVTWIWDVNKKRIMLYDTKDLMTQSRFQKRCIEVIGEWPETIKQKNWERLVRGYLADRLEEEPPEEQTPYGMVKECLRIFTQDRGTAKTKDDLLADLPWTDKNDYTYFSAFSFQRFLTQQRINIQVRDLYTYLRRLSGKPHQLRIKGRQFSCWSIPSFDIQTEDFEIHSADTGEQM